MEAYHSKLDIMDAWVTSELGSVSRWMSDMGYLQPKLPVIPGPFYVYPNRNRSDAAQRILAGRLGSYHPDDGIELNYQAFITKIAPDGTYNQTTQRDNSVTLAHEVYHGVQAALGTMQDEQTWYSEGMPEAVGRAWEAQRYQSPHFTKSDYSLPLHQPDDVYARAHFFYHLGKDLQSSPPVAYFKDLDRPAANDGHGGLVWIDGFLTDHIGPLAEYFPRFIAEHAVTARHFSDEDEIRSAAKDYSPATEVMPGSETDVYIDTDARLVTPIAAHYAEASPVFNGDWASVDDAERIYVNILSIHEADRPDDTRLIVDKTLIPRDERYTDLVYAATGNYDPPLHVRVTNVAQDPKTTAEQSFRLRLETARISIQMPTCMGVGQSEPIVIEGPLSDDEKLRFFAQGAAKIQASAGKISSDLNFTAPNSKQTVTLSVTVPTLDNGTKRIELPSIRIQNTKKDCMIRLTMGKEVIVTYSPDGDYAEFKSPGVAQVMYMKENDFAYYEGGWQPIPPMMKNMMLNSLRAGVTKSIATNPPEFRDDFQMHNMPRVFSERFSWRKVRNAPAADGGKLKRRPAPCPDQNKGCTSADIRSDGAVIQTIFNSDGTPARVMIPGSPFTFEYGGFNMRRPPGW